MKTRLHHLSLILLAFMLLLACGGNKEMAVPSNLETYADPFQDLTDLSLAIIEAGGVAAVGQGTSVRQDLAQQKAVTAAKGNLAEIFNTKVQRMNKQFQEEIGSENDAEINEAFTTVTKTLTSQVLQGAVTKTSKFFRDKETGQFSCGAVVAIEPDKVNTSILDELQKKDKKLYERFRASQAYEELKREMEEYEKDQQN
ncbi:MAG: hypothetical protein EHM72_20740 [Calditrichaeota bacterium]|nr:MAG: hypothetical protein EHM72_20740 [Calditrichota bacterium]